MKSFLPIFLFCLTLLRAQDDSAFNEVYTHTYLEIAPKDHQRALKIADSLYLASRTPLMQVKSLMLSATLYQQSGDITQAIEYANRAENIISDTDDSPWKTRVYGFLTTQYRFLKLYKKQKKFAKKTIEESHKIADKDRAASTIGLVYQEMAFTGMELEDYESAIRYIQKSQESFQKSKFSSNALFAQNEQLLGLAYLNLKQLDKSMEHYQASVRLLEGLSDYYIRALVYSGLSQLYLEKKDLKKAKEYLDQAKDIADKSDYLELKKEVNKSAQKYYTASKNIDSLVNVTKDTDSLTTVLNSKAQHFMDSEYENMEKNISTIQKDNSYKNIIIAIVVALLLAAGTTFLWIKRKQRKDIQRFKKLITRLRTERIYQIREEEIPDKDKNIENSSGLTIPPETEQKLLKQLENFENSDLYRKNTLSLSVLAGRFETNTKYLSYVINKHKRKSFQHYINGLRIEYIIKKLKNDPVYMQYKIATLADESGFSSPNKFAMVFKKVTSISPSQFIKYLDENKSLKNTEIS